MGFVQQSPVQDLIDQLKLMRVELGDVKKRQLTEERLKHLQAALEDNAKQIAGVQQSAANGGKEGAERLSYDLSNKAAQIERKVDDAVRGLSEARREASGTILARRRNRPPLLPILGPYRACHRRFALVGRIRSLSGTRFSRHSGPYGAGMGL